ncbi:MAG TPA: O-antigen ligase family protein [Chlorobiota bacterium]|nr:O-antigen ligase family protein [Chlorobiota bacterium]
MNLLHYPELLGIIPCGLLLAWFMILRPQMWLISFLCVLPWFLTDTGAGISAAEAGVGAFFSVTVIGWMIWRMATSQEPLIKSWFDWLLTFFVGITFLNIIVALANDVEPMTWFSEWSLFVLMLYYFPFRDVWGWDEPGRKRFLFFSALSTIAMSALTVYTYKKNLSNTAAFAYQIWSSRSALLGPIHLLALVAAIATWFETQHRKHRLFILLVTAANAVALVLTFTRTLWVMFFVCLAIIIVFLRWQQTFRLFATLVTASLLVYGGLMMWNPKIADIVLTVAKNRLTSSTQLSGGDRSFETRLNEASDAIDEIEQYPLGGAGMRARFTTWDPIHMATNRAAFIHIGYIALPYKLGIPIALVMYAILLVFTGTVLRLGIDAFRRVQQPMVRAMSVAMVAFLPALFVNIFMTGFFDQRWGNVMFALMFAFVGIAKHSPLVHPPSRS